MNGEPPTHATVLRIGSPGLPTTGWWIAHRTDLSADAGGPILVIHNATNDVSLVGYLVDLDVWTTDLLSLITMEQIREHTVTGQHDEREAHSGEADSDDR